MTLVAVLSRPFAYKGGSFQITESLTVAYKRILWDQYRYFDILSKEKKN
jgi:hypothetical protein